MMCLPASLAACFAGSGGPAAIVYVGGQVGGRAGSTSTSDITFALTGGVDTVPSDGDLVVILCAVGASTSTPGPAQAISGYTALGQLYSEDTADTAMNVSYKRMTATPDTQFTVPSTGSASFAQSWTVQVFRNVDPAAALETLDASATGIDTDRPNPPSVTPTVAGSWVVICGAGAVSGVGASFTAPANFTTDFLTTNTADTLDSAVGSGYWDGWTSGAVNPDAYTGGTGSTNSSWCAYTIVLPPA